VKRKKLSAIIAVLLALTFVAGMTGPLASASNVTIEFLNPLGKIDTLDNLPLAERTPWLLDDEGRLLERKVVGLPNNGTTFPIFAIAMHLIDIYGKYGQFYPDAGIILVASAFGGNWSSNTEAHQELYNNSPDGLASGGLGGFTGGLMTYVTAPAGVLPSTNAWNLAYSAHPNMNAAGVTTGTANWTGDIDVQLAGTAV